MKNYIFKPKRKVNGKRKINKLYCGVYQLPTYEKEIWVALKTSDKRIARQRLDDIVKNAEYEEAGIIPTKSIRDAAKRKLTEHLEDMLIDYKERNLNEDYLMRLPQRLHKLFSDCKWVYPSDVNPDDFIKWRAFQKDICNKTKNQYFSFINVLMERLKDLGKIELNPLSSGIKKLPTLGKQTYTRRAFTFDEIQRLLGVSKKRRIIYLFAVNTGYRRKEISQLRWSDIHLDCNCPYVLLRGETTKNKKDDIKKLKK